MFEVEQKEKEELTRKSLDTHLEPPSLFGFPHLHPF